MSSSMSSASPAPDFRGRFIRTEPPEGPTLALARILAAIDFPALGPDIQARTIEAVHDALACAVGGARTDVAVLYRAALGTDGPAQGGATVIGSGAVRATTPALAAWHNAAAINAMDYDDTARVSGHPGASVVAAALAAAEATGAGGAAFLAGVVAGYEAAFRVALAFRPTPERYALVRGSQCFLPFGAAAAAGRVLGLDAEAMARAFGIAAAHAPVPSAGKFGFDEPQLSWHKDLVHQPAEVGVRSAFLAARGYPASRTVLEGEKGYWRMIASDRNAPEELLGAELRGVRELSFKPYPCCRWLHAAMDAAQLALKADPRPVARLAAVGLETIALVAGTFGNRRPLSMVDAEFSAPHALACLLRGVAHTEWWRAETREGAEAQALMDKVSVREDAALSAAFLAGGRNVNRIPARVTLSWDDGSRQSVLVDFPMGAPGRPHYGQAGDPLDEAGHMQRKRRALLALALEPSSILAFEQAVASLPAAANLRAIVEPLAAFARC